MPTMLRRIFPHPLLTMTLTVVWLMLLNDISAGGAVLGLILGILIPLLTRSFWPQRPRITGPFRIAEYIAIALYDIVAANIWVAYLILFRRADSLKPTFLTVPLDLTRPEAITVLAGTITMTPGTVSSDLSADGRSLLVHCLDTDDPDAVAAEIKARYESRLMEIFQ